MKEPCNNLASLQTWSSQSCGYSYSGMVRGLGVLGGKSINQKKKKKFETPNKHSFNKSSTKKNTQNYCFLRYCNAVIYENGTRRLFKSSKSSMIESILIVVAMSLSMTKTHLPFCCEGHF